MNNLNILKAQLVINGWTVAIISNEAGWFAKKYILELSRDDAEASLAIYPRSLYHQTVDIKIRYPLDEAQGQEDRLLTFMQSEIQMMPVLDVIRNLPELCNTLVEQAKASKAIWGSITLSKVKGEL